MFHCGGLVWHGVKRRQWSTHRDCRRWLTASKPCLPKRSDKIYHCKTSPTNEFQESPTCQLVLKPGPVARRGWASNTQAKCYGGAIISQTLTLLSIPHTSPVPVVWCKTWLQCSKLCFRLVRYLSSYTVRTSRVVEDMLDFDGVACWMRNLGPRLQSCCTVGRAVWRLDGICYRWDVAHDMLNQGSVSWT